MPTRGVIGEHTFERLGEDECWRLARSRSFGRLGFVIGTRVQIVPTHYRLEHHTAYVRTSSFGAFARRAHRQPTTIQVEAIDDAGAAGWSVLMSGISHRVEDAATLAWLWPVERDHPWAPGSETQWVALDIDDLDGRQVIEHRPRSR